MPTRRPAGEVQCSQCGSPALPWRWYCRACQRASDARTARERKLRCLELEVQVPALKERVTELELEVAALRASRQSVKEAEERVAELEEYSKDLEKKLRAKVYREAAIAARLASKHEAGG